MRVHTDIPPGRFYWLCDEEPILSEVHRKHLWAGVERDDLLLCDTEDGRQEVYRFIQCDWEYDFVLNARRDWTLRFVGYADERPVKALLKRATGLEGDGR